MTDSKPQYAILRIEKLKTKGSVASQASHVERTRPTKNADPKRTHLNRWLVGKAGMYAASEAVWSTIPKMRSDAVLALDVMITASPEAFDRETGKLDVDKWAADSVAWIEEHFKGAKIVGLQLQLDESTPHIQGIIIPTEKKPDGDLQLNAKKWLGGKAKLRSMQTSYAKAVAHHGLERGIEGSEAKHEKISAFYGAITSKSKPRFTGINIEPPPIMMTQASRSAWAEKQTKAIIARMKGPVNQLQDIARSGIMHQRQNEHLKRSNSRLNADLSEAKRRIREQSDKLRQLPLTDVAERLGCYRPDKAKDKGLWMTPAGKVFIKDDVKFINHGQGEKGGGAIDFVKHVRDCDFKEAVAWLGDMYGTDAAIEAAATAARLRAEEALKNAVVKSFALPENTEKTWPRVKEYLVKTRGLAEAIIDKLKSAGWLYSDKRNNVVFVNADAHTEKICAYELKGTSDIPFRQAQGNSKKGIFFVEGGTDKLAVCESAIDAISYVQLHPRSSAVAVAGTGKYEAVKPLIARLGERFKKIVCASDNDLAGESMAMNLQLPWEPPARRGADWNAFLRDPTPDPEPDVDQLAEPADRPQRRPERVRDETPGLG